jgi:predicted Holliday junction resolvase-like endonuclease
VSEAKFLGSPVDFVVFKGMDEKDIEEVVFVEVKTGSASLSGQERRLRDAVKEGRVSWEMYRAELDE